MPRPYDPAGLMVLITKSKYIMLASATLKASPTGFPDFSSYLLSGLYQHFGKYGLPYGL
jgi:hypothetical protein